MKFPKSMHADGWDSHISADAPRVKTNSPAFNQKRGFKAGAKPVSLHTPLHGDAPAWTPTAAAASAAPAAATVRPAPVHQPVSKPTPAFASAAPAVRPAAASQAPAPAPRSSSVPWVVGAGVGVLLIGGAVAVSRNLSPSTPAEPATPVVVGQVTPSPEDAQLQSQPPGAGPTTTPADAAPVSDEPAAKTESPALEPAPAAAPVKPEVAAPKAGAAATATAPAAAEARIAKAPVTSGPPVWTATPAPRAESPAPVVRTLTPQPEVLAQASPQPLGRETPQALPAPQVAQATPADAASASASGVSAAAAASAASPAVPPVATAPLTPPVVAQAAPAPAPAPATPPATPDPADTQITVQVRQALAADAALSAVPIAVSTDHGVVKLEGQAPDVQARERATVVAANTVGVKAVDNRLTLPPVASADRLPASGG